MTTDTLTPGLLRWIYDRAETGELIKAPAPARPPPPGYIAPKAGCRRCSYLDHCTSNKLWLTDNGMPCERLLKFETRQIELHGGFDHDEDNRKKAHS